VIPPTDRCRTRHGARGENSKEFAAKLSQTPPKPAVCRAARADARQPAYRSHSHGMAMRSASIRGYVLFLFNFGHRASSISMEKPASAGEHQAVEPPIPAVIGKAIRLVGGCHQQQLPKALFGRTGDFAQARMCTSSNAIIFDKRPAGATTTSALVTDPAVYTPARGQQNHFRHAAGMRLTGSTAGTMRRQLPICRARVLLHEP